MAGFGATGMIVFTMAAYQAGDRPSETYVVEKGDGYRAVVTTPSRELWLAATAASGVCVLMGLGVFLVGLKLERALDGPRDTDCDSWKQ